MITAELATYPWVDTTQKGMRTILKQNQLRRQRS